MNNYGGPHGGAVDNVPTSQLQGPGISPELELICVCVGFLWVVLDVFPLRPWRSQGRLRIYRKPVQDDVVTENE